MIKKAKLSQKNKLLNIKKIAIIMIELSHAQFFEAIIYFLPCHFKVKSRKAHRYSFYYLSVYLFLQ